MLSINVGNMNKTTIFVMWHYCSLMSNKRKMNLALTLSNIRIIEQGHLIYIYVYMYTCSFIVHILPPFVDLYIIHYVFIAYSTLNIVSFVYIYIYKFICF